MAKDDRGDKSVHRCGWTADRLTAGHDAAPHVRRFSIDVEKARLEALGDFLGQPRIQPVSAGSWRQPLDAMPQLRQRYDADENLILDRVGEPSGYALSLIHI